MSYNDILSNGEKLLISIIIPTRDRADYLKYSVQTALKIDDIEIEVIVSDNASSDHTKKIISSIKDNRLKYINTGKRVSMRENFEFALKASSGEYVIFFGDDDGIIPDQFKYLRNILLKYKPDALSWDFLTYVWPIKGYGKKTGGLRFVKKKIFGNVNQVNNKESKETLLNADFANESILPRIYHGCMSRHFLDTLINKDGIYFCSRSPDLHISFRATQKGGRFFKVNHPFSINGISPASTGGGMRSQDKTDKSISKSLEFISESKKDTVKDVIPLSKSMGLGFLSALETVRLHFPDPNFKPNYYKWYIFCLQNIHKVDRASAKEILDATYLYSQETSTKGHFHKANTKNNILNKKLKNLISKINNIMFSFRISANLNNKNDILTAVQMSDIILSDDIEKTLLHKNSLKKQFSSAKRRSKNIH